VGTVPGGRGRAGSGVSHELLLEWASERGRGSWATFREAHDWLFNAGRQEGWRTAPARTANSLATLGHIEIDWINGLWAASRPALTILPSAGGHGLLTGGRTRALLSALEQETAPEITMDIYTARHAQTDAPDAIFLACRSERDIEELAARLGITYAFSLSERLSSLLPPLDSYLAISQSTPAPKGFGVERFNATNLRWAAAASDASPGLYRYQRYGHYDFRFLTTDHHHHALEMNTGIYAELSRIGRRVLRYEPEATNGTLVVPAAAPLPILHARAAVLCSGLLPAFDRTERTRRFVNVPRETARRIAHALDQELDELDVTKKHYRRQSSKPVTRARLAGGRRGRRT
jgi:hypothetical protein